ncbi:HAMP domain-containing histidine kinase [bacterium]|nr:HAMP domain-containing histidine kinase [bacterium]
MLNDVTELKELDRLKSEMVRMASHDLKNPLMGAMAYLDLLTEDLENDALLDVDQERAYAIQMIEKQLLRMDRIIRGILDVERLRLKVTPNQELCDPRQIVQHCIDELDFQIKESSIELNVDIENNIPRFMGSREHFERALVNLLENAIKFSVRDEKHIAIKVRSTTDQEVVFEVTDSGVGIPDAVQHRVFDRFFRAEQAGVEHVTGSGLGLSLVKAVVESQHGRVWLKSQEGIGTTFYIAVPAAMALRN